MNLRIHRTGEVQVSIPLRTPMTVVYRFIQDKWLWIEKHRERLQQLQAPTPQIREGGECVYFKGVLYPLLIEEGNEMPRVDLTEEKLHLYVKSDATSVERQAFLNIWYQGQMQAHLPALFERWQSIIGVSVNKVNIKLMKTRWGSCHPIKKHISLNLRLIEKPLICLEYVIVHELVHLLEASHNQRFHALMSHYMPDWKQIKKELNRVTL